MKAILLRHAEAGWSGGVGSDFNRRLTEAGRSDAKRMGAWLRATHGDIAQSAVSAARRTVETWELLGLTHDADVRQDLYLAEPDAYARALQSSGTMLIVGHNPGIARLAELLSHTAPDHQQFHRFSPCACLVLSFEGMPTEGAGQVIDFVVPGDLPGEIR